LTDLLPHPWTESTSPKVRAIVDAFDAAAGELDTAVDAAIAEAQIDNAADLTDLTELLGPHQPAVLAVLFGLVGVDNTRRLLRAIAAANHSHGDIESIIAVFDAATADLTKPFQALQLERDDSQYAAITDAAQTGLDVTGALTIEARVRFESLPTGQGTRMRVASKYLSSGGHKSYAMAFASFDIGPAQRIELELGENGSNTTFYQVVWEPEIDRWYRVAARFDPAAGGSVASRTAVFVDGVELTETIISGSLITTIFDSSADFVIGDQHGSVGDGSFDGDLRNVKVWSRALTDAEIADGPESSDDLEGDWRLDGDYSDASGNGNTLTPVNDPVFVDSGVTRPVDIRVETSAAAELEIQFEHSPAPLDDLGFRDILRSILGRAASGGIVVSHVTTSL
jgi:hypothetical protein